MIRVLKPVLMTLLLALAAVSLASAADPEIPITIENNVHTRGDQGQGRPAIRARHHEQGRDARGVREQGAPRREGVPGDKTLKIRMGALKPGTYKFFGEYHEATAKGRIVAE